jgi:hypothetical protein
MLHVITSASISKHCQLPYLYCKNSVRNVASEWHPLAWPSHPVYYFPDTEVVLSWQLCMLNCQTNHFCFRKQDFYFEKSELQLPILEIQGRFWMRKFELTLQIWANFSNYIWPEHACFLSQVSGIRVHSSVPIWDLPSTYKFTGCY